MRRRYYSKEATENLLLMLKQPAMADFAEEILSTSDRLIQRDYIRQLDTLLTARERTYILTMSTKASQALDQLKRVRMNQWTPHWSVQEVVSLGKREYNMNNLMAKRGHKPPKKKGVVLCRVGVGYAQGRYCEENKSWLINGQFVKPSEVIWYKEKKRHDKKVTGRAKDAR